MIGASWINGHGTDSHARCTTTAASAAASSHPSHGSLAAKVRLDHALVGLDHAGRPFGDLLAVIQHEHGLAEPHDDLHVVLHQQDGPALVPQSAHRLEEIVEQRAVHAGGRLVE